MDKTINNKQENKEIDIFKREFTKILKVFFGLQRLYMQDQPKVIEKINIFKSFLSEFNKKYPNLEFVLEQHDMTSDDLKILIKNYQSKEEIIRKYKLNTIPIMIRKNNKYNALQVFMNYNHIDRNINHTLSLLCQIAVEKINKIELTYPKEIKFISAGTSEDFSSSNRSMVNK